MRNIERFSSSNDKRRLSLQAISPKSKDGSSAKYNRRPQCAITNDMSQYTVYCNIIIQIILTDMAAMRQQLSAYQRCSF